LHNEEFHNKLCHDKQIKEAGYVIGAYDKNAREKKHIHSSDRKTQTKERILKTLA